jgi:hypothetical protein
VDRPPDLQRIPAGTRAVVLVEGTSDAAALCTLAARRGMDLRALGVAVVPLGGVTSIRRYLEGALTLGLGVAGLCDEPEAPAYRRGLERAGLGDDLAAAGFFICSLDLEDELIRALGPATVEQVLGAEGDLASFRRFQREPAQRTRPHHAQLRRFMGTRRGRKVRYGQLLVEALDLGRVPEPLDAVLERGARAAAERDRRSLSARD